MSTDKNISPEFTIDYNRQWQSLVKEKMSFMERTFSYIPFTNYTEQEVINKLEKSID